uniref:Variable lymphocyte receptor B n=1 Tax=Eptatretus burgeri TaxID=7764 RepID=Q4G1L4_EPTBU|nr:variable lymphocyte receptor B [Eptatretus burgeri]
MKFALRGTCVLLALLLCCRNGKACPSRCSCSGTKVYCNSKGLTAVPTGIPASSTWLSLYDNKLQSLPHGVFDKQTQLKELHLNQNQLQSLPNGVFDKLTKLTALGLHTNQLKSVPDGIFDRLTSLQRIYLFNNPWDCECPGIHYLSEWIRKNSGIVYHYSSSTGSRVIPDSAKCSGSGKPVRSIICPTTTTTTTTTTMPTTTTLPTTTKMSMVKVPLVPPEAFGRVMNACAYFPSYIFLHLVHGLAAVPLVYLICHASQLL